MVWNLFQFCWIMKLFQSCEFLWRSFQFHWSIWLSFRLHQVISNPIQSKFIWIGHHFLTTSIKTPWDILNLIWIWIWTWVWICFCDLLFISSWPSSYQINPLVRARTCSQSEWRLDGMRWSFRRWQVNIYPNEQEQTGLASKVKKTHSEVPNALPNLQCTPIWMPDRRVCIQMSAVILNSVCLCK